MLQRRLLRKRLLQSLGLREQNVVSHVNGSCTVAVRQSLATYPSIETLKHRVEDVLSGFGYTDMVTVREGRRRGVIYVTYSSPALVEEAIGRYGIYSLSNVVANALAALEGAPAIAPVPVTEELTEELMEEFDFDAIAENVSGLVVEASEA